MPPDFKIYRAAELRKVNAQRRALSAPADRSLPILSEASVLFSAASESHGEPRSCANCCFYNSGKSCMLHGPHLPIRKFKFPLRATADSKVIEYWPVCGYWAYGEPSTGEEKFLCILDPSDSGLGWVNAPEVGLSKSGTCCGGGNGGDDCDFFITKDDEMHGNEPGFCRVLQKDVANMDCCGAWQDDDWIPWERGVEILRGEQ